MRYITGIFLASSALRRGDVGSDHIILDQPVGVEPVARRDRGDPPLLVEHDLAFGQVEFERPALAARGEQRAPARPQRLQRGIDELGRHPALDRRHRTGRRGNFDPVLIRRVDRRLRVFIGDVGRDTDFRAGESPRLERPVLADMQMTGQRRPVLARLQRTDIGRQFLRQHRHDPVGEIDAVAALPCLACRAHYPGRT